MKKVMPPLFANIAIAHNIPFVTTYFASVSTPLLNERHMLQQLWKLFERACCTGAGAITPSTQARQCSNSPLLIVVGAFHFARK
jgi:hypothetical protein